MEERRTLSLGCGSLILIALVVAIFTATNRGELIREVGEMDLVVQRLDANLTLLNQQIKVQNEQLTKLNDQIERLTEALGGEFAGQATTSSPRPALPPDQP